MAIYDVGRDSGHGASGMMYIYNMRNSSHRAYGNGQFSSSGTQQVTGTVVHGFRSVASTDRYITMAAWNSSNSSNISFNSGVAKLYGVGG